jgi:hypothetical protein
MAAGTWSSGYVPSIIGRTEPASMSSVAANLRLVIEYMIE